MLVNAKRSIVFLLAFAMIAIGLQFMTVSNVYADGATLDNVLAAIGELSNDPRDFTAADTDRVEAIQADYEALSADDQAKVDSTFNHPSGDGQSYGRILEAAVWAVRSFDTDTSTALAGGTYTTTTDPAVSSQSDKGKSDSSRTRNWWVESVVVENGQAKAYIYVTSGAATASKLTSYSSVWAGGQTIDRDSNNNYAIPVDLNGTTYFGGISSSMPRPIMYSLSTSIKEVVDLKITNNTGMFKAETASLQIEGENKTLVMALSGTGYHELYKGTYEQAVVNGDGSKDKGNNTWIHGYQNAAGKWEFKIPVEDGKSYMPLVAISNSYYEKYLNSENSLARAFYPRQATLNIEDATLVTDDFNYEENLAVTSHVEGLAVSSAKLKCVGGPNSNGFSATLTMAMGDEKYSNAYVGTSEEAEEAGETVALEDGAFAINVRSMTTAGDPSTVTDHANGETFALSLKEKESGKWIEYVAAVSEEDATLTLNYKTVDLTITNTTNMFKAETASLQIEGENKTLVMALSGTGYHELYKGTYEQAVVNGDGSKDKGNNTWIHGYQNAAGKWEFKIPVEDGKSYMPLVAISDSYYKKYLNSENSLARAFYPRQAVIDADAKTLVTGDYECSQDLEVTNNISMFKTPSAKLDTVGGPNSNNYKADLIMTMQNDSYTEAFVGTYAEANEATSTIALADDNTLTIPVKWVEEFGKPETLKTLTDGKPFYLSFRAKKSGNWFERKATLNEAKGTLVLDPSKADYTEVDSAIAAIPGDLSIYTEESAAAVTAARDAVVRDKFESQQAEVDAMAQAINDAVTALKKKPAPTPGPSPEPAETPVDTASKATDAAAKAAESVNTPEELATAKAALADAEAKLAEAEKSATAADQAKITELKNAIADLKTKVDTAEQAVTKTVTDAAAAADEQAVGYTEDNYMADSVATIETAKAVLEEAKAGGDLVKISDATKALNEAMSAAVEKEETTIAVVGKTTKKTFGTNGKTLKKKKSFRIKAKASSGSKVTYKKVSKGNKKITVAKNGKVTLKKGLKTGVYTVKVKATAKYTDTAKTAAETIAVKIRIK